MSTQIIATFRVATQVLLNHHPVLRFFRLSRSRPIFVYFRFFKYNFGIRTQIIGLEDEH